MDGKTCCFAVILIAFAAAANAEHWVHVASFRDQDRADRYRAMLDMAVAASDDVHALLENRIGGSRHWLAVMAMTCGVSTGSTSWNSIKASQIRRTELIKLRRSGSRSWASRCCCKIAGPSAPPPERR